MWFLKILPEVRTLLESDSHQVWTINNFDTNHVFSPNRKKLSFHLISCPLFRNSATYKSQNRFERFKEKIKSLDLKLNGV